MRPIPHSGTTEGEERDDRTHLTTRRTSEETPDDDETWLTVQEF